jgi:hypothetical protein
VAVNRSHINCLHSSRQDVLWLSRRLFLWWPTKFYIWERLIVSILMFALLFAEDFYSRGRDDYWKHFKAGENKHYTSIACARRKKSWPTW